MRHLFLLLLLAACGRYTPLRTIEVSGVAVDAGPLPKPSACTVAFGGPSCCGPDGRRVTAASCVDGDYVCSTGSVCSCDGVPQTFFCSDFCGSDAYVEPTCGAQGWFCPSGLRSTADCPAGTCWGEPGDLCSRPTCVDGEWTCRDTDGGINDPET